MTAQNSIPPAKTTMHNDFHVVELVSLAISKLDREGWSPGLDGGQFSDNSGNVVLLRPRTRFNNATYTVRLSDGTCCTGMLRSSSGRVVMPPTCVKLPVL